LFLPSWGFPHLPLSKPNSADPIQRRLTTPECALAHCASDSNAFSMKSIKTLSWNSSSTR
jgi:hypothetical protein